MKRHSIALIAPLAALVFCVAARAGDDLSLPAVLARHAQAVGHSLRSGQTSATAPETAVRISGTLQRGSQTGTFSWTYVGDKDYDESTLSGLTTASGTDGKVAWRRDENGNVRLLSAEELKNQRTDVEGTLRKALPGQVTLRSRRERKTGDYVLDLLPDGGKPVVVYLNPNTFLVDRTQVSEDEDTVTTTFQKYETKNGLTLPVQWVDSTGNAQYDETVTVTKAETGVSAPDSLFTLPPTRTDNSHLTSGAASVTMPFTLNGMKAILLPVSVNGKQARMYLDSGDAGISLFKEFADALALPQAGVVEGRGYGGTHPSRLVHIDTLDLTDALTFTDLTASTVPVRVGGSLTNLEVGLIGYGLLARYIVRIDYDHRLITFSDPKTWTPTTADGQALPLELNNDEPTVLAQVDDLPPARFLVDTGDSGAVRLYLPYLSGTKLKDRYPKGVELTERGTGGEFKSRAVKANTLTLGSARLNRIPMQFPLDIKGGGSQIVAGAIGADALSRFVVTFDYPHQRLYLASTPTTSTPFDTRSFGISLAGRRDETGALRVFILTFDKQSPAYKSGLATFDEVLQLDGHPVADMEMDDINATLSPAGGQNTHTLQVRHLDGKTKTYTVTLYDTLP